MCDSTIPESLGLQDNDLSGTLPFEIGFLVHLESFEFYENKLTGMIPSEIGLLERLSKKAIKIPPTCLDAILTELSMFSYRSTIGKGK